MPSSDATCGGGYAELTLAECKQAQQSLKPTWQFSTGNYRSITVFGKALPKGCYLRTDSLGGWVPPGAGAATFFFNTAGTEGAPIDPATRRI